MNTAPTKETVTAADLRRITKEIERVAAELREICETFESLEVAGSGPPEIELHLKGLRNRAMPILHSFQEYAGMAVRLLKKQRDTF